MSKKVSDRELAHTEVIGGNEWLQLQNRIYDDNVKYTVMHEVRCNGNIVVILPYKSKDGELSYMFRNELTPPWNPNYQVMSSITGGVDTNDTVEKTAIKELKEETGFLAIESMLEPMGTVYGSKASDTVYHLFAINVGNCVQVKSQPEGLESEAENVWVPARDLNAVADAADPMVYALYVRHSIAMINS